MAPPLKLCVLLAALLTLCLIPTGEASACTPIVGTYTTSDNGQALYYCSLSSAFQGCTCAC